MDVVKCHAWQLSSELQYKVFIEDMLGIASSAQTKGTLLISSTLLYAHVAGIIRNVLIKWGIPFYSMGIMVYAISLSIGI